MVKADSTGGWYEPNRQNNIASMRHRVQREQLLRFDGHQLFVHAIDNGMVGKSSITRSTMGAVTIDGNFAKAAFSYGKSLIPIFILPRKRA